MIVIAESLLENVKRKVHVITRKKKETIKILNLDSISVESLTSSK